MTKPLTDDEKAMVRYIRTPDLPATEPVPELLTESLRRIAQSANPVDTLRKEFGSVDRLTRRHDIERGVITER